MDTPVTIAHIRTLGVTTLKSIETIALPNDKIRKRDRKFHGNFGINKAPSYYFAVTFAPADTTAHCNVLLRVEVIHCV